VTEAILTNIVTNHNNIIYTLDTIR